MSDPVYVQYKIILLASWLSSVSTITVPVSVITTLCPYFVLSVIRLRVMRISFVNIQSAHCDAIHMIAKSHFAGAWWLQVWPQEFSKMSIFKRRCLYIDVVTWMNDMSGKFSKFSLVQGWRVHNGKSRCLIIIRL